MEDHIVFRGIIRNYRIVPVTGPEEQVHCSVPHMMHTLDDKSVGQFPYGLISHLDHWKSGGYPSGIPENRVVEIIIRVTDEHAPIGDDPWVYWVYQKPHTYGPNSQVSEEDRAAIREKKMR